MNLLRITGIVSTITVIAVFFISAEILKEHIEGDLEKADLENPFIPYSGLFLFGVPPSIGCIVISFLNTTKSKIMVFSGIIIASYIGIFTIAILMLNYPTIFGIPETYWDA